MRAIIFTSLFLGLLCATPIDSFEASNPEEANTDGGTQFMQHKLLQSLKEIQPDLLTDKLLALSKHSEFPAFDSQTRADRQRLLGGLRFFKGKYLAKMQKGTTTSTGPDWIRHYASGLAPGHEIATAMVADDAGNIYVTGYSSGQPFGTDYFTIKYDASGRQLWIARHDGPDDGDDIPYAIAVDDAGNVYVTGGIYSKTTMFDYGTVKYNANGIEQWVAYYNGPGDIFDIAVAMAVDGSGNVYITGMSMGDGTFGDYATIKYDTNGQQQWIARYNGSEDLADTPSDIAVDALGNVFVTGTSEGLLTGKNYTTIKYDSYGNQQWIDNYDGDANGDDEAVDLALDLSGNVYVTGNSEGEGTEEDFATIKYNPAGSRQWISRYNGPENGYDEPVGIVIDPSGYICVVGTSEGATGNNYTLIKLSITDGVELWNIRYATESVIANAMIGDDAGNIYITGTSYEYETQNNYLTIKFNANGTLQWINTYNGPDNLDDEANAIAVDGSGNVYVTGGSYANLTLGDYATIKYNSGGFEQWNVRYNSPQNSIDAAFDMTVDGSGNVYVSGEGIGPDTTRYFTIVKYNTEGTLQWTTRYNDVGADYTDNNLTPIAIDDAGNVYVAGASFGQTTRFDIVILKYDPNGNQLWVRRYNGIGNGDDIPVAIVLDKSGNLYITGESYGSGTGKDYVTLKYSSDGNKQWAARYNGPSSLDDTPVGIAVDIFQNVFVTGTSIGMEKDFATIKYNSTGNVEWATRYSRTTTSDDEASGIVIDAAANVYVTGTSGQYPENDFTTIRYNPSGVFEWVDFYDGPVQGNDEAKAIAFDKAGFVYVTGSSETSESIYDYATIKYRCVDGSREWVARYSGPEYPVYDWQYLFHEPVAIIVDDSGNSYVTGYCSGIISDILFCPAFITVKYSPTGEVDWVEQYQGSGFFVAAIPFAMALDDWNNVYVAGTSLSLLGIWNTFTTLKYGTSDPIPPAAPTNLQAHQIPSQIHLTWDDNSNTEDGFYLEVEDITSFPATWDSLSTVGRNVTSYQMDDPIAGHRYVFRARAFNGAGNSAWSNEDTLLATNLLAYISIISPAEGDYLTSGKKHTITWDTHFPPPVPMNFHVTIQYSIDGGCHWVEPVIADSITDRGSFEWLVPYLPCLSSDNCIIKIEDATDGNFYDLSNKPFTISIGDAVTEKADNSDIPADFKLSQNHPNPFNAETMIHYQIAEYAQVEINIYNISGQLVRTLVNERKQPGKFVVQWNGRDDFTNKVGSGVYFCKMEISAKNQNILQTQKMIFLK